MKVILAMSETIDLKQLIGIACYHMTTKCHDNLSVCAFACLDQTVHFS